MGIKKCDQICAVIQNESVHFELGIELINSQRHCRALVHEYIEERFSVTATGPPFPNSSIEVPGNKKSRLQLETPPMHKSLANFLLPKLHWKSPAVAEVPQIPWGQRDIALKC